MRAIRLVGTTRQPPSPPFVHRADTPGLYEMWGDRGNARLIYFYDQTLTLAICTHDYEARSRQERERAFGLAERIRQHYLSCLKTLDCHEHGKETP